MKIVIKLLFVSCLIISLGCKKQSKELTTVNFHLYNPVTNEPYAGVKVKVLQDKQTGGGLNIGAKTETIWEGVTDANGKASHSFKAKNGGTIFYWQYVDQSFTQNSTLKLISQPEFLPLNKNEVNEVIYKSVKNVNYVFWIKNIVCFNETDKCKMRRREYSLWANVWKEWGPLSEFDGCYEYLSNTHTQKILEYEMEITRNGLIDTIHQTFYITGQNGTDTLKIFY